MKLTIILAAVFGLAGTACNFIDIEDHWTVPPTDVPAGLDVAVADESEPINQAERSLEDFVAAANTYIERRQQDIEKEQAKVGFIEGLKDSGLAVFGETVGMWAGPWAPLLTLLVGYKTKRRGDLTKDEAKAREASEKEASYNKGYEVGLAAAKVLRGDEPEGT